MLQTGSIAVAASVGRLVFVIMHRRFLKVIQTTEPNCQSPVRLGFILNSSLERTEFSSGHLATRFTAFPANRNAFVHAADLFATLGTRPTDFGAGTADGLMQL